MTEVSNMTRRGKEASKAAISAASAKGNAEPTVERDGGGKTQSGNTQYKK
jgi:hypothetical protein